MVNKWQAKAHKSKLNISKQPSEKVVHITRTAYSQVRSFRFDDASWNNLNSLLEKINSHSTRKISASRLIKALIQLGIASPEEQIIAALKEIVV